jgi:hypothetical protein
MFEGMEPVEFEHDGTSLRGYGPAPRRGTRLPDGLHAASSAAPLPRTLPNPRSSASEPSLGLTGLRHGRTSTMNGSPRWASVTGA